VTGIRVQHWLDDDDPTKPGDYYQSIVCPACARLHFVNRKTGRLLGQQEAEGEVALKFAVSAVDWLP
jgi:hypothetical protein